MILVHGTFAFLTVDDEKKNPPWWSPYGEFCQQLDSELNGMAECWPDEASGRFPWFDEHWGRLAAYSGRKAFSWSGHNSEEDRQAAGDRLLEGLVKLENSDPAVPYHLVGHSYGGAVIWNALVEAARRGIALDGLRSWTTLGTPFPRYVPKPLNSLDWFAAVTAIALVSFIVWFLGLRLPHIVWPMYAYNLSPTTIIVLVATLMGIGLVGLDWAYARRLRRRLPKDDVHASTAWKEHGNKWLGVYSRLDEAFAGLRDSIGLYVRIPWTSGGPKGWLVNAIVAALSLPLNYRLRLFTQGAPTFGALLGEIARAPLPHDNDRGILPEEVDKDLRDQADQYSQLNLASSLSEVRNRLVHQGAVERAIPDALRWIKANVQLEFGLYHNYYYLIATIRQAIAYHILRHAQGATSSGSEIGSLRSAIGPKVLAWLAKQPGAGTGWRSCRGGNATEAH